MSKLAFPYGACVAILLVISTQSCATESGESMKLLPAPTEDRRQIMISLTDKEVRITGPNGEPLETCLPCANKDECARLREVLDKDPENRFSEVPICLQNVNIHHVVVPISLFQATENPDCVYVSSLGSTLGLSSQELTDYLIAQGISPLKAAVMVRWCFE
jgi:hypothetical protein